MPQTIITDLPIICYGLVPFMILRNIFTITGYRHITEILLKGLSSIPIKTSKTLKSDDISINLSVNSKRHPRKNSGMWGEGPYKLYMTC